MSNQWLPIFDSIPQPDWRISVVFWLVSRSSIKALRCDAMPNSNPRLAPAPLPEAPWALTWCSNGERWELCVIHSSIKVITRVLLHLLRLSKAFTNRWGSCSDCCPLIGQFLSSAEHPPTHPHARTHTKIQQACTAAKIAITTYLNAGTSSMRKKEEGKT